MNIYYRVTQVDYIRKITYYELEIPFQSYYITVYFATSHLPHKRLAKYRPLSYFMIFPGDVLGIIVCQKYMSDYGINIIENPNKEKLRLLIEKVGKLGAVGGVRLAENIVNEFLKTLY